MVARFSTRRRRHGLPVAQCAPGRAAYTAGARPFAVPRPAKDSLATMNVIGFYGHSGSGKTTLVEQLIARLKRAGRRVSVVKRAHHAFDIDHQGKDSWRHRQAGACEVVIASDRRLAKIREFDPPAEPTVHDLIRELGACDWVLVEGFKSSDLLKMEVWRAPSAGYAGNPARYPDDDFVVAIATDSPDQLPQATLRPVLDLNDIEALALWLIDNQERFVYRPELYA